MNNQEEYAAANELAFSGRYPEARESLKALLQRDPSHVEALILLGKVEYYLGRPAASLRAFETALFYQPENMAAFFGLEYHRQRKRSLLLVAGVVVLIAAIGVATVFLAARLTVSMRQMDERLDATSAALSATIDRMGSVVEDLRNASTGQLKETSRVLSQLRAELEKLRRADADLLRRIEETRGPAKLQLP